MKYILTFLGLILSPLLFASTEIPRAKPATDTGTKSAQELKGETLETQQSSAAKKYFWYKDIGLRAIGTGPRVSFYLINKNIHLAFESVDHFYVHKDNKFKEHILNGHGSGLGVYYYLNENYSGNYFGFLMSRTRVIDAPFDLYIESKSAVDNGLRWGYRWSFLNYNTAAIGLDFYQSSFKDEADMLLNLHFDVGIAQF